MLTIMQINALEFARYIICNAHSLIQKNTIKGTVSRKS
jgi:hypothetical protein